ncbi:sensor histidine kinase [Pseudonocardia spinosispora]|uniref:sensor histidine kinase n=1 Tax=Pseudonocardia spinosispora TaxID=103441 RepID=UPI00048E705B|nr:HAMP domain-containing sensor histidine kinase [Pseudonocardia spinosispora]
MAHGRGPGLRLRLTVLCTVLAALVSALLLWLGWLLVGGVVSAVPALPPGTRVRVREAWVPAEVLGRALADAARADVLRTGLLAFPLVVVAAAVVSWLVVGRVLRPLRTVTGTARRLSAESLDERISLVGRHGEVTELADSFDAMLDRLHDAFEMQRRFVANASHELRTPLAVMRTEVDVTLADPEADVPELRRMAEVVRGATYRADALVEGLLLLARTEAGVAGPTVEVDLAELVRPALAAVRAEADERRLRVRLKCVPASTAGDPALLERVVGNLVENAVRHNLEGGWLEVATEVGPDGRALLRVASSGASVPDATVEELFEPFRRGARRAAGSGSGLGLSIVRAVVSAHRGTVVAESVAGGGLAVTVRLPSVR